MDRFPSNLGHTSLWLSLSDTYYSLLTGWCFHDAQLRLLLFLKFKNFQSASLSLLKCFINLNTFFVPTEWKTQLRWERSGNWGCFQLSDMGEQHEAAGVQLVSELELLCALLLQTAGLSLPNTARGCVHTKLGLGLSGRFLFSFSHNYIKQRQGHAGIWFHLLNWKSAWTMKDESLRSFFFGFRTISH